MDQPQDLLALSKKKLISLCKERDISGISKLNRFELIALLSIDSEVEVIPEPIPEAIKKPIVEPIAEPIPESIEEDTSKCIINVLILFFTLNIIFTSIYVYMRF